MAEQKMRKLSGPAVDSSLMYPLDKVASFLLDKHKTKDKGEKYLYVALWVLKLEALRPQRKWKMTELAKFSGISRTWIYENFSKNCQSAIDFSVDLVLKDAFGMTEARKMLTSEGGLLPSVMRSKYIFESFPEVLVFYFRSRHFENEIGFKIRQAEQDFSLRLSKLFNVSFEEAIKYRALFHGLATSPFIEHRDAEKYLVKLLEK